MFNSSNHCEREDSAVPTYAAILQSFDGKVDEAAGITLSEFSRAAESALWEKHLTHRLRVLLHANPLLNLKRNDNLRSVDLRHYDTLTLALKLFDLIIEHTGLEQEIDGNAAIHALLPLLRQMDLFAEVPPDLARQVSIAEHVLDELRQQFSYSYIDMEAGQAIKRLLDIQIIQERHHPDGRIVLRLSNEATNLFLNGLKLDIEDAQAAAEAIVHSQLLRGRFDEAVNSAQAARFQSIRFQEKIEQLLRETRRDVNRVNWQADMPRILQDALDHIELRSAVEENISESAREKLNHLVLGGQQAAHVARVAELVEECCLRHAELRRRLIEARNVFLDEQERQIFAPQPRIPRPNLLTDVLDPLLQATCVDTTRVLETVFPTFFGAHVPQTFSLARMLNWQLQPKRDIQTGTIPLRSRDLTVAEHDLARYSMSEHERATDYIARCHEPTRLNDLLQQAHDAGEDHKVLELIALIAFCHFDRDAPTRQFTTTSIPGVALSSAGFAGDDLWLYMESTND